MKQLLIATVAVAGFAAGAAAQDITQPVRIATEGAYAPWNYIDESGAPAGFELDLAAELCARAMLECEIVISPWDTMIPNLLAGNYDVIMAGMAITEERLASIDFSDSYHPPEPSRYAMRAGRVPADFAALTGLRIGVQTGTIQQTYVAENLPGNTVVPFETFDQAVADLSAGNVDLVLADAGYIEPIAAASGRALVIDGPPVLIGGGVGAGMRKEDDALTAAFDAAIAAMKADGSLNALITEWFEAPNLFP